jgi:hypothetical protein
LDIINLSPQELLDEVTRRRNAGLIPAGIYIPPLADIEAVKQEAQVRLSTRQRALQTVQDVLETNDMALTQEKNRINTEGIIAPELETYERAINRYDEIGTMLLNMTREQLLDALSPDPANAGPRAREFLPAEGEAGQCIAKARFMQWLFDHRNANQDSVQYGGQTGREAAYRRNNAFMDDARWLQLIQDEFQLVVVPGGGGPPGPPGTLPEAVAELNFRVGLGEIRPAQFARFFQQRVIFGYMVPRIEVL